MNPFVVVALFIAGSVVGAAVAWLVARALRQAQEATFSARVEEMGRAQQQLKDAFQSLCAEALRGNNEAFVQLARAELEKVRGASQADLAHRGRAIEELLAPIRDGLAKYDDKIVELERSRSETFGALAERLAQVTVASEQLRGETGNLVKALRAPAVRGRWGEVQLTRVCELAGMLDHCDFRTQESVETTDATGAPRLLRPDLTVKLPGGKTIVVDAKAPLAAFLEAVECDGEEARRRRRWTPRSPACGSRSDRASPPARTRA